MSREAMQLALEALEKQHNWMVANGGMFAVLSIKAMSALRQALETPKYRRGDRLLCLETEEYCVIHISGTDRQYVKFPDGHVGQYTNQQVAEHFELLPKEVDADDTSEKRVDETVKREHEPLWSAEECERVIKTLRYIQGIAERGEGRAMRDDETLEQFVLGYVKKLEQQEQEPVAWISDSPTRGNGKQLHWTKAEAWRWSSNITPLYTAPQKQWVGLTALEIYECWKAGDVVEAVEAKLKEKNT